LGKTVCHFDMLFFVPTFIYHQLQNTQRKFYGQ
jgi:hypothetical protein